MRGRGRVVLEEKYFRRIDEFTGDSSVYRRWLFDMQVAISQVDPKLANYLRTWIESSKSNRARDKKAKSWAWNPSCGLPWDIYDKYSAELYTVMWEVDLRGTKEHPEGDD